MDFTLTDEQVMLRDGARRFLAEQCSTERVREVMESEAGYDHRLWEAMAEQGWQAMHIPEAYGGAGFTFAETAILLHEMGRVLAPVPHLSSSVLACEALLAGGSEEQKARWLPGIASGGLIATFAVAEPGRGWDELSVQAGADEGSGGSSLTGTKSFVTAGHYADLIIVAARGADGVGLYAVEAGSVQAQRLVALDSTRSLATIDLASSPAARLDGADWETVERIYDVARTAIAVEQVGGLERVLEMSVEYAKERKQFGRPIGSFQAIKHMCAEMLVALESARSAAGYAVWALSTGSDELAVAAPMAKAFCSEAFFKAAGDSIQIHGGIGFTWEHDAHLYFKRAKSTELLLGAPSVQRRELAGRVGL
ncbi:MAG: acyl-CoA dehydrogenase family protein [Acidimicrobiia bacterium]